ncbi:NlpC/P60 family protein [Histomonas meleagridis]|uniref:NlpC/P60 family protein n=1 Tax=Histomonas meleagridis TaxID=135588 RepID=UPI003559FC24|nr:NlpC/P60 family protein [Histomonas meleagridis]KAH0797374.1 NlpC/P60 family protein [Histomonas meleagridis]
MFTLLLSLCLKAQVLKKAMISHKYGGKPRGFIMYPFKFDIKGRYKDHYIFKHGGKDAYIAAKDVKVIKESNSVGDTIVSYAKSKIGCDYVSGATGPNTFDCSGFTQWCHKQVGISIPRTSSAQAQSGTKVSEANLKPGDVCCFYNPVSHVGIYSGSGNCIHAPHSGDKVKSASIKYMSFQYGRRYW